MVLAENDSSSQRVSGVEDSLIGVTINAYSRCVACCVSRPMKPALVRASCAPQKLPHKSHTTDVIGISPIKTLLDVYSRESVDAVKNIQGAQAEQLKGTGFDCKT